MSVASWCFSDWLFNFCCTWLVSFQNGGLHEKMAALDDCRRVRRVGRRFVADAAGKRLGISGIWAAADHRERAHPAVGFVRAQHTPAIARKRDREPGAVEIM